MCHASASDSRAVEAGWNQTKILGGKVILLVHPDAKFSELISDTSVVSVHTLEDFLLQPFDVLSFYCSQTAMTSPKIETLNVINHMRYIRDSAQE
jgi:hypothetical protein